MKVIDKKQLEYACNNTKFLQTKNFGKKIPLEKDFKEYFDIKNTLYIKGERVGLRVTDNNTCIIIGEVTNR